MEDFLRKTEFIADASLPVTVVRRAPQPDYPLHAHEFSELVIVYKGNGIHFSECHEQELRPGDVFVIHGQMKHGYRSGGCLELVNIIFDPESIGTPLGDICHQPSFRALFELEPAVARKGGHPRGFRLSPEQLEQAMRLVDTLEEEIRGKKTGYRMMIIALFMQLAACLSRYYEKTPSKVAAQVMPLGKVISYIEKNYVKPIRLKELVKLSNMSESNLARAFLRYTGKTPIDYVIALRVQRASTLLLKYPARSVAEIGYETGFSDSNYFSRQFKRNTGKTPREYRKRQEHLN